MWKITVERGRSQMTIWRMRIAFWIPNATKAHSGCVTLIAFPLQQWLHERGSMLRYQYNACLVVSYKTPIKKKTVPNKLQTCVISEVLTLARVKIAVFSKVTPCNLVD
jgi:hypothetical protein